MYMHLFNGHESKFLGSLLSLIVHTPVKKTKPILHLIISHSNISKMT